MTATLPSLEGMVLQGFTVHSRDAVDRTETAWLRRENRQASVNVNSVIARNLLRRCSITVDSVSLPIDTVDIR